jgi:Na+/proline symporter
MQNGISWIDIGVLVFYFGFLFSIGWLSKKFIKNTSDYFRGSGQMLWWMAGASAFMMQFSAWTFTGAASDVYSNGLRILSVFWGNALGFAIAGIYFARKFRQMRVITAIQGVRQRFGKGTEQVYTWLSIPTGVFVAGLWLNGLSIFIYSVFGSMFPSWVTVEHIMIITALIVLFNSTLGGSWAVVASDFMQMVILMGIAVVMAIGSLHAIGGPAEIVRQSPVEHLFLGNDFNYGWLIAIWMISNLLKFVMIVNNPQEATRYLTAKDSKNASKAAWMASALFLIGPIIWFIPPLVAAIKYPDLAAVFPGMGNPEQTAYVVMAFETLPVGLMGLLIAGMFAATISSMDTGLNRNAGIFVKNFYQPVLRKHASGKEQMLASKITTLVLGTIIVAMAMYFNNSKAGLFKLMMDFTALVSTPTIIPLLMMFFVKRTPDWAAWGTVLFGLIFTSLCKFTLTPEWANTTFGLDMSPRELNDFGQMLPVVMCVTFQPIFFYCTRFFYKDHHDERAAELQEFIDNQERPVTADEHEECMDHAQGKMLGSLAGVYGSFVILIGIVVLVINLVQGNPITPMSIFSFLGVGGAVGILGWILAHAYKPKVNK